MDVQRPGHAPNDESPPRVIPAKTSRSCYAFSASGKASSVGGEGRQRPGAGQRGRDHIQGPRSMTG